MTFEFDKKERGELSTNYLQEDGANQITGIMELATQDL